MAESIPKLETIKSKFCRRNTAIASFKLRRSKGGGAAVGLAGPSTILADSGDAKACPIKNVVIARRRRERHRTDDRNDSFVWNMSISVRGIHKAIRTSLQHNIIPGFSNA